MSENDKKSRDAELDDFWNLENLTPKKSPYSPSKYIDTDSRLADVVCPASKTVGKTDIPLTEKSTVIKHFIPPYTGDEEANKPKPIFEYAPENSLIHKVEIFSFPTRYNNYTQMFDRMAHENYGYIPKEIPENVSFFSYVPHYIHMNRMQSEWYSYWREQTRHGIYHETDYSYVLLYIYELLSLYDVYSPCDIQQKMCGIWVAYRKKYPQLDRFLGDWICDFSLINKLPSPELSEELFGTVMKCCTVKEYFIRRTENDYSLYADVIAKYCSSYDYRKSKFYPGYAALYDKHIPAALEYVMTRYSDSGKLFSGIGLTDSHIVKDTFVGAPFANRIKRKLEADFCSFSRTNDLRYTVGDIIKYCENCLRAILGIKSRFSSIGMHAGVRTCVDEYFSTVARSYTPKKTVTKEDTAESDPRYNIPDTPFSLEKAMNSENASWQTTEILTAAFENGIEVSPEGRSDEVSVSETTDTQSNETAAENNDTGDDLSALPETLLKFIGLCLDGDLRGQTEYARSLGKMPDAMADEINERALDIIGDILLESEDGGYSVISDYTDLLGFLK